MKSTIITLFYFIFCLSSAQADKFSSSIHSIHTGSDNDSHLIRFNNGRVGFVKPIDFDLLESLELSKEKNETIEAFVDDENNLFGAQTIYDESKIEVSDDEAWEFKIDAYQPSILKTSTAASNIFNLMRRDYRSNGQCYNRAHIWVYEEYMRSKTKGMKIFMFFTERYIRNYKYHWWFHVTPMYYVENISSPRTLDRRYTSQPLQTKTWSDIFIKSKRACKKVKEFKDFWLNQETEDCYHIHASMYYLIPRDLEKRDLTGLEKNKFNEKEVKRAYKEAFN